MPTYIIGDVQGRFDVLQQLLKKINFKPDCDRLGFVGDLVNRGRQSAQTLRFLKSLDDPIIVLGNHDLHLIAIAYNTHSLNKVDTLQDVIEAPDKTELIDWLRFQPLFYHDNTHNVIIVHAGLPPQWTIEEAKHYANLAEMALKAEDPSPLLKTIYGSNPTPWQPDAETPILYHYIVNAFTRLRFCTREGRLNFTNKTAEPDQPDEAPWFSFQKTTVQSEIIFGHWAALEGYCPHPCIHAIDTGCGWGGSLTALRLEDRHLFSVPAQ